MQRILLLTMSLLVLPTPVAFARTYSSEKFGYSLEVPEGWVQIPDGTLQEVSKATFVTDEIATSDAAFQPAELNEAVDYCPNLIVTVIPYSKLGLNRPPTRGEMGDFVAGMSKADTRNLSDKVLQADVLAKLSLGDSKRLNVELDSNRVSLSLNGEIDGIPVTSNSVYTFGRRSMVVLCMSSERNQSADMDPIWREVTQSFRFAPGYAYQRPTIVRKPAGELTTERIIKVAFGSAVVVYLFRRPWEKGKQVSAANLKPA